MSRFNSKKIMLVGLKGEKGDKGDPGSGGSGGGTTVTVKGEAQETWDADTKVPITPDGFSATYAGLFGKTGAGKIEIVAKTSYWDNVESLTNYNNNGNVAAYSHRATGENVLYTGSPDMPNQATNKKYVDENFVAKSTDKKNALYGTNSSGDKIYNFEQNPYPYSAVMFTPTNGGFGRNELPANQQGTVVVANPLEPYQCANKKYVDENSGKVYKHNIYFEDNETGAIFNYYFLSTLKDSIENRWDLPFGQTFIGNDYSGISLYTNDSEFIKRISFSGSTISESYMFMSDDLMYGDTVEEL